MLAVGIEFLISQGHAGVFDYTPKRLVAFVELANKRKNRELIELFSITRTSYHGEKKDCNKLLKELKKNG